GVEEGDELTAAQADAEVLRPRLAERVGADVADAGIGEERPHDLRGVVRGAVINDDQLPVGGRLGEHRLDRGREEPGVVLRGHHDGDERGHAESACNRSRATFEMQNRYFPDGSCGIASTYSTSY